MHEARRIIGLELAGAKNQKTSLAVLEFYPKEKKTFLLDIFDKIGGHENETSDEALLEIIQEMSSGVTRIGVNVPLGLPPCITCTRKHCPHPKNCTVPAVKWMRNQARKTAHALGTSVREFTPYTQRPVELWMRYHILNHLPPHGRFEIDETLGGNRAPLTARMSFLKRHLNQFPLVEVWPKLSATLLCIELGIPKRILNTYRHLEHGIDSREDILSELTSRNEIFIYERDLRKLAQSLTAFDAFLCAYTALLADRGVCVPTPKGFPKASGWVQFPVLAEQNQGFGEED